MDIKQTKNTLSGWVLLFIPLVFLFLFLWLPLLSGIFLSLFNAAGFKLPGEFVGFSNYIALFADQNFWQSILNTLSIIINSNFTSFVLVPLAVAFLLIKLNRHGQRGTQAVVSLLLISCSPVVMAFAIRFLLSQFIHDPGLSHLVEELKLNIVAPDDVFNVVSLVQYASGLSLSLPLGLIVYMSLMRGALYTLDENTIYKQIWSKLGRIIYVLFISSIAFSFTSLEAKSIVSTMRHLNPIAEYIFDRSFYRFQFGYASAMNTVVLATLLYLGGGVWAVLKKTDASISFNSGLPEKNSFVKKNLDFLKVIVILFSIIICFFALLYILFTIAIPLINNLFSSIKLPIDFINFFPREITLNNYQDFFTKWNGFSSIWNTKISSLSTLFMQVILGLLGGYALGYLRPKGSKVIFFLITSSLFITPNALLIPSYFLANHLRITDTPLSLILPWLGSPLAIFLFTLFFKGMRNGLENIKARLENVDNLKLQKKIGFSTAGFSLLVFCILFIVLYNNLGVPWVMSRTPESSPLNAGLFILNGLNLYRPYGSIAAGLVITSLQYILPIVLLIILQILFLPKFSVLVLRNRKNRIEKYEPLAGEVEAVRGESEPPEVLKPIPKALIPNVWIGAVPLTYFGITFIIASLIAIAGCLGFPPVEEMQKISLALIILSVCVAGVFFVFIIFGIYRIHKILCLITDNKYQISPAKAVGFHFIPIYNYYWLFKWTNRLSKFVNRHKPENLMSTTILCICLALLNLILVVSLFTGIEGFIFFGIIFIFFNYLLWFVLIFYIQRNVENLSNVI